MILHENKTFLAYRCPHCGTGVIGLCGTFALGGGRLFRLRCACGESNMSVCETADHKIRLSVPCLLCRTDHHYVLSPSLFFGKELFLLNCTYSDLDICFIGTEEKIRAALSENEATLRRMFQDAGLAALSRARTNTDPPLPDTEILDILRFLVRDLEEEGRIDCPCHNGDYEIAVSEEGISVRCRNCGARFLFPVDSVSAAQAFLSCDSLTLQDPDNTHSLKK